MSFNLVMVITILSDFEAKENKICHCFKFISLLIIASSNALIQYHTFNNHFFKLLYEGHYSRYRPQFICWGTHTTAAKSLQSCPTPCDPINCSPPGSPVPGFSRQEHRSGLSFPSPVHESEK